MAKKRKAGRPKMAKTLKKVGFSIKVNPELFKRINSQTKGNKRSTVIEAELEKVFIERIA